MNKLIRFGISLEKKLLERFDKLIKDRVYPSRSEAIRDLIREELVKEEWSKEGEVVGAITLVYNHHKREIVHILNNLQHDFQPVIISTQHVHLDHDNCLEVVVVRGKGSVIKELAMRLKAPKGVKHSALIMTTTGKKVP